MSRIRPLRVSVTWRRAVANAGSTPGAARPPLGHHVLINWSSTATAPSLRCIWPTSPAKLTFTRDSSSGRTFRAAWQTTPDAIARASQPSGDPVRASHRGRHHGRRRPRQHHRSPHRQAAGHLASRPAARTDLARAWAASPETGVIGPTLKMQLRMRARSDTYTDRSQAAKLLEYCIGRRH